ncbi:MAG: GIY-YIG nuclease family protein [Patescibacteria group bacterium]
MHYTYILFSKSSNIFYYGSTSDLENRFQQHNNSVSKSTKGHAPWILVWYCVFPTQKQAEDFEKYLKSGSGKAFAYKRLVALAKDELLKDERISRVSVALAKGT